MVLLNQPVGDKHWTDAKLVEMLSKDALNMLDRIARMSHTNRLDKY